MSRVSIIVPVYKVEKYLNRCIESVVNQTYTDIEIVLVDDGSPDNCPDMCDEWAKKDNRIRVVHKENAGLSSARKAGLDVANGEYVLFVDSDDYIELNMVELMMNKMISFNTDMVMCSYFQENKESCKECFFEHFGLFSENDIIYKYVLPIAQSGIKQKKTPGFMCIRMFKRELIKFEYFYDENKVFTEDDVFNILYALNCKSIYVMNVALYHYVYYSTSLSNRYRKGKFEMWCNRAMIIEEALEQHHVSVSNTDVSFIYLPGVFSEINNSAIKLNYSEYKKRISMILRDSRIKNKMRFSYIKYMRIGYMVSYFLLKTRCYNALYYVRKKRLGLK